MMRVTAGNTDFVEPLVKISGTCEALLDCNDLPRVQLNNKKSALVSRRSNAKRNPHPIIGTPTRMLTLQIQKWM